MDMDDARPFETVHACTPKRIGVRTSSAAAAPAAQAQAEKLPPSLNNMLEFPSLLPPPSMKPAPPSKSRKSKPKKVMMEIDTVGTQNDKSLDFKKGDLVFGPKDGIKEAFYPHVVRSQLLPCIHAIAAHWSDESAGYLRRSRSSYNTSSSWSFEVVSSLLFLSLLSFIELTIRDVV